MSPRALALVTVLAAVIIVAWAIAFNAVAFDVFVGSGVIGTLILLGDRLRPE